MIREDPDRPGTYLVDVSAPLLEELERWGPPVQMRIEDGELVFRRIDLAGGDYFATDVLIEGVKPELTITVERPVFEYDVGDGIVHYKPGGKSSITITGDHEIVDRFSHPIHVVADQLRAEPDFDVPADQEPDA